MFPPSVIPPTVPADPETGGDVPPSFPYPPGAADHLTDELARVATLVRAYLLRRRSAFLVRGRAAKAGGFPPECDAVAATKFGLAEDLGDPECRAEHAKRVRKAAAQEADIAGRLAITPDAARNRLPVWALSRTTGLVPNQTAAVAGKGPRDTVALDVLLVALLADRFPAYRAALAAAPGDDGSPAGELTAETALRIAQPTAGRHELRWAVLGPDEPLRRHDLIAVTPTDRPGGPLIRIDPWVADVLLGRDEPFADPTLGGAATPVRLSVGWDEVRAGGPGAEQLRRLAAWRRIGKPPPACLVVLLHGPRGTPFRAAVAAFLTAPDGSKVEPFLGVDAAAALKAPDWPAFVRRVYRTAELRRRHVLWTGAEAVLAADPAAGRWEVLIHRAERSPVITFLASDAGWDPADSFREPNQFFARAEFAVPPAAARRVIWQELLAEEKNPLPADNPVLNILAGFQFTEGLIRDALATARGLALTGPAPAPATPAMLVESCRRQSARRLVSFAQRLQPEPIVLSGKGDLRAQRHEALRTKVVLTRAVGRQLEELLDRMDNLDRVYQGLGFEERLALGRGLVALFTGPSGTGKTLSASALAALLGKDLYKVDAAAVVSQFVGVTEKNLSRVFADAQDANAVLFFDEADSLFGKRGTVERAQDRWANLEVNYLLQRVEEYTGTVILATNLRPNIDPAFARRVQVMIEFKKPEAPERLAILKGMFAGTPVVLVDEAGRPVDLNADPVPVLDGIAKRFELTGGNLKNVVLDAVFRAAAETPPADPVRVTPTHLLLGVAREYLKEGLTLSPAAFGRDRADEIKRLLELVGD